ncbi:helix-turn-helix domain-containing protein [Chengkuizengella sp. SCS-71B]|uniref:helix-turn-helix domain-containing protein n=1 Tax=Chengkuizengella sp. SCS-71B TaxID=3115290 RepID=UPI0032C22421
MLSDRLKQARKELKLTQEELAKKVNTTKGTISNYENGYSTPSNEMLTLLADILNVTTDFLLGRNSQAVNEGKSNINAQTHIKDKVKESLLSEFDKLSEEDQKYIVELIKKIKK